MPDPFLAKTPFIQYIFYKGEIVQVDVIFINGGFKNMKKNILLVGLVFSLGCSSSVSHTVCDEACKTIETIASGVQVGVSCLVGATGIFLAICTCWLGAKKQAKKLS